MTAKAAEQIEEPQEDYSEEAEEATDQTPEEEPEGEALDGAKLKDQEKALQKGFQKQAREKERIESERAELEAMKRELLEIATKKSPAATPETTNKLLAGMEPEYRDAFVEAVRDTAKELIEQEVQPIRNQTFAQVEAEREKVADSFFESNPDLDTDEVWEKVTELYPLSGPPPTPKQLSKALSAAKRELSSDEATLREKIRKEVLDELSAKGGPVRVKKGGSEHETITSEDDLESIPMDKLREMLLHNTQ